MTSFKLFCKKTFLNLFSTFTRMSEKQKIVCHPKAWATKWTNFWTTKHPHRQIKNVGRLIIDALKINKLTLAFNSLTFTCWKFEVLLHFLHFMRQLSINQYDSNLEKFKNCVLSLLGNSHSHIVFWMCVLGKSRYRTKHKLLNASISASSLERYFL